MRLAGLFGEEEALIWSAADLMGGDGSPAEASESEEERRIQMASLRTWREAGNEPLSSYHRQQAVKMFSFLRALGMFFFDATKHFFFSPFKKIHICRSALPSLTKSTVGRYHARNCSTVHQKGIQTIQS